MGIIIFKISRMSRGISKKIEMLIKKWPTEVFQSDKILSRYFKGRVSRAYAKELTLPEEAQKLEALFNCCNRLVSNTYQNRYQRLYPEVTSSGIDKKIPKGASVNLDQFVKDNEKEIEATSKRYSLF